jgi:hypothetical protein
MPLYQHLHTHKNHLNSKYFVASPIFHPNAQKSSLKMSQFSSTVPPGGKILKHFAVHAIPHQHPFPNPHTQGALCSKMTQFPCSTVPSDAKIWKHFAVHEKLHMKNYPNFYRTFIFVT